jgi:hypothetical protein
VHALTLPATSATNDPEAQSPLARAQALLCFARQYLLRLGIAQEPLAQYVLHLLNEEVRSLMPDEIDAVRYGAHAYTLDGTSDCAHGCGCWMGPYRSGGPVDPFGPCPKNPLPVQDTTPALLCESYAPNWLRIQRHRPACERPRGHTGACTAHAREVIISWPHAVRTC